MRHDPSNLRTSRQRKLDRPQPTILQGRPAPAALSKLKIEMSVSTCRVRTSSSRARKAVAEFSEGKRPPTCSWWRRRLQRNQNRIRGRALRGLSKLTSLLARSD